MHARQSSLKPRAGSRDSNGHNTSLSGSFTPKLLGHTRNMSHSRLSVSNRQSQDRSPAQHITAGHHEVSAAGQRGHGIMSDDEDGDESLLPINNSSSVRGSQAGIGRRRPSTSGEPGTSQLGSGAHNASTKDRSRPGSAASTALSNFSNSPSRPLTASKASRAADAMSVDHDLMPPSMRVAAATAYMPQHRAHTGGTPAAGRLLTATAHFKRTYKRINTDLHSSMRKDGESGSEEGSSEEEHSGGRRDPNKTKPSRHGRRQSRKRKIAMGGNGERPDLPSVHMKQNTDYLSLRAMKPGRPSSPLTRDEILAKYGDLSHHLPAGMQFRPASRGSSPNLRPIVSPLLKTMTSPVSSSGSGEVQSATASTISNLHRSSRPSSREGFKSSSIASLGSSPISSARSSTIAGVPVDPSHNHPNDTVSNLPSPSVPVPLDDTDENSNIQEFLQSNGDDDPDSDAMLEKLKKALSLEDVLSGDEQRMASSAADAMTIAGIRHRTKEGRVGPLEPFDPSKEVLPKTVEMKALAQARAKQDLFIAAGIAARHGSVDSAVLDAIRKDPTSWDGSIMHSVSSGGVAVSSAVSYSNKLSGIQNNAVKHSVRWSRPLSLSVSREAEHSRKDKIIELHQKKEQEYMEAASRLATRSQSFNKSFNMDQTDDSSDFVTERSGRQRRGALRDDTFLTQLGHESDDEQHVNSQIDSPKDCQSSPTGSSGTAVATPIHGSDSSPSLSPMASTANSRRSQGLRMRSKAQESMVKTGQYKNEAETFLKSSTRLWASNSGNRSGTPAMESDDGDFWGQVDSLKGFDPNADDKIDFSAPIQSSNDEANGNFQKQQHPIHHQGLIIPKPFILRAANSQGNGALHISHFGLGPAELSAWSEALCHQDFRSIHLTGNRMQAQGMQSILKGVFGKEKNALRQIDLSENQLGPSAIRHLANVLPEATLLESLVLAHNSIGNSGCKEIFSVIPSLQKLHFVDVRGNKIGSEGAVAIGAALSQNCSIKKLDVGWNELRGKGACQLMESLAGNTQLVKLKLAWNGIDQEACKCLADSLVHNRSIAKIDLSRNKINDIAGILLAYALRRNQLLRGLKVNGNALGRNGAQALLRHMRLRGGDLRKIDMHDCNIDAGGSMTFDPNNPNGKYELDLSIPLDRAIASELWELSLREQGENWRGETLDGRPFDCPEDPDNPWIIPTKGYLQLRYFSTPVPPSEDDIMEEEDFSLMIDQIKSRGKDKERKDVILSAAKENYFSADQVKDVITTVDAASDRVEVASGVFSRVVDLENKNGFLKSLKEHEQKAVARNLGQLFFFNPKFPTGHYRLDLSNKYDFLLAQKLQQLSNKEKFRRKSLNLNDTSQYGNGECWRNQSLNGEHFRYTGAWHVPEEGILELDYVSVTRPPMSVLPMGQKDYEVLRGRVEEIAANLGSDRKGTLAHIDSVIRGKFLTSEMLMTFANYIMKLPSLTPVQSMFVGVQVVVSGFGGLVDINELWRILRDEFTWDFRQQVCERLGWLNVFNPMYSEGYIELDLSMRDEHVVAEVLVDLSVKEPGENWLGETYNGNGFELPTTWVEQVPDKGILTLEYYSEPAWVRNRTRKKWLQLFLSFEAPEKSDDDFLGKIEVDLAPLLRIAGPNPRLEIGPCELEGVISGTIQLALFAGGGGDTPRDADNESDGGDFLDDGSTSTDAESQSAGLAKSTAPNTQICTDPSNLQEIMEHSPGWQADGSFVFGVHLICAKDLIPMDETGTSDPFAKISIDGQMEQESAVVAETLHPHWDEKFFFHVNTEEMSIEHAKVMVELFDKDF